MERYLAWQYPPGDVGLLLILLPLYPCHHHNRYSTQVVSNHNQHLSFCQPELTIYLKVNANTNMSRKCMPGQINENTKVRLPPRGIARLSWSRLKRKRKRKRKIWSLCRHNNQRILGMCWLFLSWNRHLSQRKKEEDQRRLSLCLVQKTRMACQRHHFIGLPTSTKGSSIVTCHWKWVWRRRACL